MAVLISPALRKKTLHELERNWRDRLQPPSNEDICDWVEANVVLPPNAPYSGFLRLDRTPYLRDILRTIHQPQVETITLCFSPQVGKTLAETCIGGYCVCHRPTQILFGISTKEFAQEFSTEKLEPFIEGCEPLKALLLQTRQDDTQLKKRFATCTWTMAGGMSSRQAKHRSIGLLLLDEIDEMGKNVFHDFQHRANAYKKAGAKVYQSSTPTLENAPVWAEFLDGSREFFEVACPDCGEFQRLVFEQLDFNAKDNRKEDGTWDINGVRRDVAYVCPHCQFRILDSHKYNLLLSGKWVAEQPDVKHHRSFHLNCLYSPFLTWATIATEFLKAEHYPDRVKKFRTNSLAQPWTIETSQQLASRIRSKCGQYQRGEIALPPVALVLTADIGKRRVHWVVTGIAERGATFVVDVGTSPSLEHLADMKEQMLYGTTHKFVVNFVGVDCGYDTPEVRDFCHARGWIPIFGRGQGQHLPGTHQWNKQEGHLLLNVDLVKDIVADKIEANDGKWQCFADDGQLNEFFAHLGAEERYLDVNSDGWGRRKWRKIGGRPNHYFDCCIYAEGLSIANTLRFGKPIRPAVIEQTEDKPVKHPEPPQPDLPPDVFDRLRKYGRWHKYR